MFLPIVVALLAGCITAVVSAVAIAWALGATFATQASVAPKSATLPIAMEVDGLNGGLPSLTTIAVAITGISGAIMAGFLLYILRVKDPRLEAHPSELQSLIRHQY